MNRFEQDGLQLRFPQPTYSLENSLVRRIVYPHYVIKLKVAIISVGAGNSYGHPTAETLGRLAVGAKVYRANQAGTVTVSTDGNTYTVAIDKTGGSAPVGLLPRPPPRRADRSR